MSSPSASVDGKAHKPVAKVASKYILGAFRGPVSNGDTDIQHAENPGDASLTDDPKVQRTKKQKLRRHCARFWCCYAFGSIIFLAIFLPVFFLVAIPSISQLVVNKASLVLVNAAVLEPRPDSVVLTVEATLDLPIALPERIDPLTLELFNRDQPENNTFAKVHLDGATIHGSTTLGIQNVLTPLNVPQWTRYVRSVVLEPHAPLPLRGSTTAYLGKLKNHVKMDKDIHQNTLNSFAGFSIESPQILLPPRDDGTNLIANATLPNPSVMTLQIGTTVVDLKSGDYVLGNATLENLILHPGNHSTPIHGILDLPYLIDNVHGIMETQGDALEQGHLNLQAVGRSVVYDGVEVPYYSDVMKSLTLTAQVPLGSLLVNTFRGIVSPNGTNVFHNLTDPNGPTNIQDILDSIDDPDNSLGLNNTTT